MNERDTDPREEADMIDTTRDVLISSPYPYMVPPGMDGICDIVSYPSMLPHFIRYSMQKNSGYSPLEFLLCFGAVSFPAFITKLTLKVFITMLH